MVTPHNSLTTRENKSVYLYHRQLTSNHTHINIVLFTQHTSIHHTQVPPVVWRSCPIIRCVPQTGFTSQQQPSNLDRPPSPTALPIHLLKPRFCFGPHNNTAARQNLKQHTRLCSLTRASPSAHKASRTTTALPRQPPVQSRLSLLQSRLEYLSLSLAAASEWGGQGGKQFWGLSRCKGLLPHATIYIYISLNYINHLCLWTHSFHNIHYYNGSITKPHSCGHFRCKIHMTRRIYEINKIFFFTCTQNTKCIFYSCCLKKWGGCIFCIYSFRCTIFWGPKG